MLHHSHTRLSGYHVCTPNYKLPKCMCARCVWCNDWSHPFGCSESGSIWQLPFTITPSECIPHDQGPAVNHTLYMPVFCVVNMCFPSTFDTCHNIVCPLVQHCMQVPSAPMWTSCRTCLPSVCLLWVCMEVLERAGFQLTQGNIKMGILTLPTIVLSCSCGSVI